MNITFALLLKLPFFWSWKYNKSKWSHIHLGYHGNKHLQNFRSLFVRYIIAIVLSSINLATWKIYIFQETCCFFGRYHLSLICIDTPLALNLPST